MNETVEEGGAGKKSVVPKPWEILSNYLKRFSTSSHVFIITMAIFIGILGGFGAVGFRLLIRFFGVLMYGGDSNSLTVLQSAHWSQRLFLPMIGGLVVGPIIYKLAREAKGHGVPEVIESLALRGGIIRPRVVFIKALVSSICIGSGGSVGREGPIAQIGSAAGSAIGQLFKVSARNLKTFVGCGAAAGIAATFNAPIAGALFSVEILLGDFRYTSFSPIVVSSVAATVVSRHYLGNFPAFVVTPYSLVSAWEFIPYLLLGLVAGLVAYLYVFMLYRSETYFEKLRFPEYMKPALGGILLGIIGIFLPQVYGIGYDTVDQALIVQLSLTMLIVLMFAKIVAISLTLGSGGSGGIFAPSLFIGAMMGGVVGSIAHVVSPAFTAGAGAYSMVGMGALVASATQAPITAILMIFEMTGDYRIILPLMVSCTIATLVYSSLSRESIYLIKLVRRGVRIERGREVNVLQSIPVRNVMLDKVRTIPEDIHYLDIMRITAETNYAYFPVVDGNGEMTGILSLHDLRKHFMEEEKEASQLTAKGMATKDIITASLEDNLDDVFKKFGSKNIEEIPVVAPANPKVPIGMIRRREAIEAYNNAILKRSQQE